MLKVIDRNILNDDILYNGKTKDDLIERIKKWKLLLTENYGVRKGEVVCISILDVNALHVACLLACGELGLKVILLDAPATEESLPYTKLALHGPADYVIHHKFFGFELFDGLHGKMVSHYTRELVDSQELVFKEPNSVELPNKVKEDDVFLISSTSGSTKPSRKIEFTHKEVYEIAKRNIDVFKFKPETKVLHTKNMHHVSSMLCDLLPSLMTCKKHSYYTIGEHELLQPPDASINDFDFDHLTVPNLKMLDWLFKNYSFKNKTTITMCGFTIPESFRRYCIEYPIEFISHYGSIDTGIPVFVNYFDKNSEWVSDRLGTSVDDFYVPTIQSNGEVSLSCSLWSSDRVLEDDLYKIKDDWYIRPRNIFLDNLLESCPETVDLDKFSQDTKLNMEQLRGHVKEIRKKYDLER